jgi:hypothetical protein
VERPDTRSSETQDSPDGRRYDNQAEGLVVVDDGLLVVVMSYPESLVTGKSTIRVVLMREDPFARG